MRRYQRPQSRRAYSLADTKQSHWSKSSKWLMFNPQMCWKTSCWRPGTYLSILSLSRSCQNKSENIHQEICHTQPYHTAYTFCVLPSKPSVVLSVSPGLFLHPWCAHTNKRCCYICPRDSSPRRPLSKGTNIQGTSALQCPRKLWSKETFVQGSFPIDKLARINFSLLSIGYYYINW